MNGHKAFGFELTVNFLVTAGTNTKCLVGEFNEDRPEPGGHM